jgi:hypothetical protein
MNIADMRARAFESVRPAFDVRKRWDQVPECVREMARALGMTTRWSALDWYAAMQGAVERTVEREGLDFKQSAVLRRQLFERLGEITPEQAESVATFTSCSGLGLRAAADAFYVVLREEWGEDGLVDDDGVSEAQNSSRQASVYTAGNLDQFRTTSVSSGPSLRGKSGWVVFVPNEIATERAARPEPVQSRQASCYTGLAIHTVGGVPQIDEAIR